MSWLSNIESTFPSTLHPWMYIWQNIWGFLILLIKFTFQRYRQNRWLNLSNSDNDILTITGLKFHTGVPGTLPLSVLIKCIHGFFNNRLPYIPNESVVMVLLEYKYWGFEWNTTSYNEFPGFALNSIPFNLITLVPYLNIFVSSTN